MKLKCFFGLHKWDHSWEQAEFARLFNKSDVKYFQIHVRYCPECGKKQRSSNMPRSYYYNRMTVEQKRDKKISDLGI